MNLGFHHVRRRGNGAPRIPLRFPCTRSTTGTQAAGQETLPGRPDGEYGSSCTKLARAVIHIGYYSSPTGFYVHGKVVEAGYGTGQARMFV